MKIILPFISITLLFFFSCGVLLDQTRITGEWKLDNVEFYVQNSTLDTVKTYTGTDGASPTSSHPMDGEFFCSNGTKFTLDFDDSHKIIAEVGYDNTDDTDVIIDKTESEWQLDQFENSLTIDIDDNNRASGFWADGFKIKCYWPMPDYDTLEIHIKANEVGKSYFSVDLADKTLKVKSMKGIFKRK